MNFLARVLWHWLKESKVAKGTVTVAMGSSISFYALMGFIKEQIETVNAAVDKKILIEKEIVNLELSITNEMREKQFQNIHYELKYLRGAIDETNRNVLRLYEKKK